MEEEGEKICKKGVSVRHDAARRMMGRSWHAFKGADSDETTCDEDHIAEAIVMIMTRAAASSHLISFARSLKTEPEVREVWRLDLVGLVNDGLISACRTEDSAFRKERREGEEACDDTSHRADTARSRALVSHPDEEEWGTNH